MLRALGATAHLQGSSPSFPLAPSPAPHHGGVHQGDHSSCHLRDEDEEEDQEELNGDQRSEFRKRRSLVPYLLQPTTQYGKAAAPSAEGPGVQSMAWGSPGPGFKGEGTLDLG